MAPFSTTSATVPMPGPHPRHPLLDNSWARELEGLYVAWQPAQAAAPLKLFLNAALAGELGLDADSATGRGRRTLFAGNAVPEERPAARAGVCRPPVRRLRRSLGDGRALLLGEILRIAKASGATSPSRRSGRTPFSPRRGRQGGHRADAARGVDRRGHACPRHSHHPGAGGGRDRRIRGPRRAAARRGADARRLQPSAGGHLPVLRLHGAKGPSCGNSRSTRSRGTTPTSRARRAVPSRCCAGSRNARRISWRSG